MEGRYAGRCLGMWRALEAGEGSHPVGSSSKDLFPSDRPHSDSARLHQEHSALNRQALEAEGHCLPSWICCWRQPRLGYAAQTVQQLFVIGRES